MKNKLSIIIPFYNEEENVESVLKEVLQYYPDEEIIAIDDGSNDKTWEKILEIKGVKGIHLDKNCGQSAAIYMGLKKATGDICILMDGDGQNDPSDIEILLKYIDEGDMICGIRQKRSDVFWKRFESYLGNTVRRFFLKDGITDTGCSLKAFKRAHVEILVPFDGMHRFLPAYFYHAGLKLKEVSVNHRSRIGGVSKYRNFTRGLRGLYDTLGLRWFFKRRIKFPEITTNYES